MASKPDKILKIPFGENKKKSKTTHARRGLHYDNIRFFLKELLQAIPNITYVFLEKNSFP